MGEARRRKLLGLSPRKDKYQWSGLKTVQLPIVTPRSKLLLSKLDLLAFVKLLAKSPIIKG